MQAQYDPAPIEAAAQQFWRDAQSFRAREKPGAEKFYCLGMFPYPSGRLHMGHVRNYAITDLLARYQRMRGKNVLHPMGWDAFGLPAENAALEQGTAPATWTYRNIAQMRQQLEVLGFSFDWSREIATCQPDYYRWEQWFFTRLYERGLVYKKMAAVNWDPVDKTVLAREQVIDGRGWRSGALVEQREIPQWFIKITAYAEELLAGLDKLDGWPAQVRTMQRNWIGKSRGQEIVFELAEPVAGQDSLTVYSTRPDTLLGATWVALAATHPVALALAADNAPLAAFIDSCRTQSRAAADMATMSKRGLDTGLCVVHPLTDERLPLWVANYVLTDYGSGAVMAVPAHDQRDWEFAQEFGLPIKQVIAPADGAPCDLQAGAFVDKGRLVHCGDNFRQWEGLDFAAAFEAIAAALQERDRGRVATHYRLRDWGISRQRYWGAPIPMFCLPDGGEIPVPAERLPVLLPEDVQIDGSQSPLNDPDWCRVQHAGQAVQRETDTFDTFMESSWYYARFTCPDFAQGMLDRERANYWLPVDQYVGGIEHAILHLLYARFFHRLLRDDEEVRLAGDEPFTRLLCQGMVLAESFYRRNEDDSKTWFNPAEVTLQKDADGTVIGASFQGEKLELGGVVKMSKSRNNGVDPQGAVAQYGADTLRLFTLFAAPPTQTLEWSEQGVQGALRFLRRLWTLTREHLAAGSVPPLEPANLDAPQKRLRRKTHATIQKVSDDYERRQMFNTAIAAVMELLNEIARSDLRDAPQGLAVEREALEAAVLLLAPCTPHICHRLWHELDHSDAVIDAPWPTWDESALAQDRLPYAVQVGGKLRAQIEVAADAPNADIEAQALADDRVQRFIAGKPVRRVILVPGKLVNIVVG